MSEKLEFKLLSKGKVTIDHKKCKGCKTYACVKHCQSSQLTEVLKIEGGLPVLADPRKDTEAGWCTECLSCELMCSLYGQGAVKIDLPLE